MPSGCVHTSRCPSLPPTHTFTKGGAQVRWHPHLPLLPRCQAHRRARHSFKEDCISPPHAVFIFSLSSNSERGGSKPGRASSCHRPSVLETAHLALSVEAEASLSPITVPWCIDLCQLGSGKSSFTSDPDRKDLHPEGSTPSIPHPWPAATTAEEGPTTQTTALSPRSKAPAPCSRFWRGAIVYATNLLGYTNYSSI